MYNFFKIQKSIRETKEILKPIALHELLLTKCAFIITYYPFKESKLQIYSQLNKTQRAGMLNRYILGIASKLGIHQAFLRQIIGIKRQNKRFRNKINNVKERKEFWIDAYNSNQIELTKMFNLLLDMMIEEIDRRNNPKYLRKKKLNEIENNNL